MPHQTLSSESADTALLKRDKRVIHPRKHAGSHGHIPTTDDETQVVLHLLESKRYAKQHKFADSQKCLLSTIVHSMQVQTRLHIVVDVNLMIHKIQTNSEEVRRGCIQ